MPLCESLCRSHRTDEKAFQHGPNTIVRKMYRGPVLTHCFLWQSGKVRRNTNNRQKGHWRPKQKPACLPPSSINARLWTDWLLQLSVAGLWDFPLFRFPDKGKHSSVALARMLAQNAERKTNSLEPQAMHGGPHEPHRNGQRIHTNQMELTAAFILL